MKEMVVRRRKEKKVSGNEEVQWYNESRMGDGGVSSGLVGIDTGLELSLSIKGG